MKKYFDYLDEVTKKLGGGVSSLTYQGSLESKFKVRRDQSEKIYTGWLEYLWDS